MSEVDARCLFWALAGIAATVLIDIVLIGVLTGSWSG